MPRLRGLLAPLTALWLMCQVGTLALVPSLLQGSPAAAHGTACTCGHGDGSTCPMHHHQARGPVQCSMQPVHHSGTAVLTAVTAIVGFMTQPAGSIEPPRSVAHWHATGARAIGQRPVPPDPPPPRA